MNSKELNILAKQYLWPIVKEANYTVLKSSVAGYEFTNEVNGNILICSGGTYTRPSGLAITRPSYDIKIPKFNNIINLYFKRFNVNEVEESSFCDAFSSGRKFELGDFMFSFEINSEETFLIWLNYFKTYMEEIVEPFFEKCTTMNGLNELVDTRKNDEDLMISLGTTNAWMKKLFIIKVAKSPEYKEFSEWYLELYNRIIATGNPEDKNKYQAALALYDDLEKGVWDGFEL